MRKKRRAARSHAVRKAVGAQSRSPAASRAATTKHLQRKLLFDFIYGVVLSFAITGVAWLVGQYPLVEHVRKATYEWLQSRLTSSGEPPVAVIDISNLRTEAVPGAREVEATPRVKLIELIKALLSQQPKAIGIDIDFSPESGHYITPSDPVFFEFCLQQRQKRNGIPIYLVCFERNPSRRNANRISTSSLPVS